MDQFVGVGLAVGEEQGRWGKEGPEGGVHPGQVFEAHKSTATRVNVCMR